MCGVGYGELVLTAVEWRYGPPFHGCHDADEFGPRCRMSTSPQACSHHAIVGIHECPHTPPRSLNRVRMSVSTDTYETERVVDGFMCSGAFRGPDIPTSSHW